MSKMTKKEVIEYWQSVYNHNKDYCDKNWGNDEKLAHEEWMKALKVALDVMKEQGEWIPVSERLPEKCKDLLVYDGECMYVAYYYDDKWWSSDYHLSGDRPVKAWMPLPEPYKEAER